MYGPSPGTLHKTRGFRVAIYIFKPFWYAESPGTRTKIWDSGLPAIALSLFDMLNHPELLLKLRVFRVVNYIGLGTYMVGRPELP